MHREKDYIDNWETPTPVEQTYNLIEDFPRINEKLPSASSSHQKFPESIGKSAHDLPSTSDDGFKLEDVVILSKDAFRLPIASKLHYEPKKRPLQYDRREKFRSFGFDPTQFKFLNKESDVENVLTGKTSSEGWKNLKDDFLANALKKVKICQKIEEELKVLSQNSETLFLGPRTIEDLVKPESSKLAALKASSIKHEFVIDQQSTLSDPLKRIAIRFPKSLDKKRTSVARRLKLEIDGEPTFTVPSADYFIWFTEDGSPMVGFEDDLPSYGLLNSKLINVTNGNPYSAFIDSRIDIVNKSRLLRKISRWEELLLAKKGIEVSSDQYIAEFKNPRDLYDVIQQTRLVRPCPPQLLLGARKFGETVEELFAKVKWRNQPKKEDVKVFLSNSSQVSRALMVLTNNGFQSKRPGYDSPGELLVKNQPHLFANEEYFKRAVSQVLIENGIFMKKMEFINKTKFSRPFGQQERLKAVNNRLVMDAQSNNLWSNELEDRFPSSVTSNDFWKVVSDPIKNTQILDREETITIQFHNLLVGFTLLPKMVELMPSHQFLAFGSDPAFLPTITPVYRKLMRCPLHIRYAMDEVLKKMDYELRNMKPEETEDDNWLDGRLSSAEFVRITDDRENNNDEVIGIEGWPKKKVDEIFDQLVDLMTFREIQVDDMLFFGIGEAWVYHVVEEFNNRIVVDIDKFRRKFFILGPELLVDAAKGMFVLWKNQLVQTTIVVASPMYLDSMRSAFTNANLELLRNLVPTLEKGENHRLKFEGTINQYLGLIELFDELNEMIVELVSDSPTSLHIPNCPACLDIVRYDHYRLDACGHVYCRECINNQLKSALDSVNAFPVLCCADKCETPINSLDWKNLILGGEQRQRALDAEKIEKLVSQGVKSAIQSKKLLAAHCPTPDCKGILHIFDNSDRKKTVITCAICTRIFCGECFLEPHNDHTCEEYRKLRHDPEWSLKEFIGKNGAKNFRICPTETCKAYIEKNAGCDHIHCAVCKKHFCWKCDFVATEASVIYRHLHDKHGGTGGDWLIENDQVIQGPDDFERDIQNVLLR